MRFGGLGVWGGIFIVNIFKRRARTLRRIILLHLASVAFRFHDWKTLKLIIFMVLGLGGCDHESQKQYVFIFGDTRTLQIMTENANLFSKTGVGHVRASEYNDDVFPIVWL